MSRLREDFEYIKSDDNARISQVAFYTDEDKEKEKQKQKRKQTQWSNDGRGNYD